MSASAESQESPPPPENSPRLEDIKEHVASAAATLRRMRDDLEHLESDLRYFYTLRLLADPEIAARVQQADELLASGEGFPEAEEISAVEQRVRLQQPGV